jgi:hypothetical protein
MKTLPRMATETFDRGEGGYSTIGDLEAQDVEMQCRSDVEIYSSIRRLYNRAS